MSDLNIRYVDTPMDCCGLGMGYGFDASVPTGKKVEEFRLQRDPTTLKLVRKATGYFYNETRAPTVEDQKARLQHLEETAGRTCLLIALAAYQENAIQAAKELRWTMIHEFHNNNSGNTVYLYAKTQEPASRED